MQSFSRTNICIRLGGVLLVAFLSVPAFAHHGEEAALQPAAAPAQSAPIETVAGTLDELIVENRITNVTTRYVSLHEPDGQTVTLNGAALDAFSKGAWVEASGRRNGDTLFVTTAHSATSPAQTTTSVNKSGTPTQQAPLMQAQGSLLLAHADDFVNGKSAFNLVVHADDGQMTQLKLAVMPDVLQPGTTVIANGTRADDGFSLAASYVVVVALSKKDSRNDVVAKAATTNNVLVVLVKFTDSPASDPFTQAQVQQVMTTNATSVANYYNETSYGQHLLNATVTNWLVSSHATPANCDFNTIATYGTAAANAAGYNLGANPPSGSSYQNIYYVFPQQSSCGWAGLAYIGYGQAFSNGYNLLPVFAHELGHNFGLLHAASLTCSGQPITAGATGCTSSEYGDPFSVMGGQGTGSFAMHFNAAQKAKLGWIPASSVATFASGTATYTLTPLETAGGSTYAVKVAAAASRTFWLEYRQRIGAFDTALTYATNGAQVRVATPFQSVCSGCADDTELLYMPTGAPGNFYNSALLAGQSFTDSGITMSVLSASPTALTIQVSSGGLTGTTTSIASSINPSPAGASTTFTATISGTSPTGTVNFKDGTTSISGCSATALSGSGNTRTATCAYSGLSVGTHSVSASYSGDVANAGSSSTALAQVVNNTVNPSVALLVDHYYVGILGRAADPGGEAFWEGEVTRMQGLGVDVKEAYMVMAGYFFNSAEYLNRNRTDAQYVGDLYNTFFNRAPDTGGLNYWTGQIAAGLPRSIVMYGFMFSPEFNSFMSGLFSNTSSRAEVYAVIDFYRGILNRLPDTTGFNSALTQFRTAQCAGAGQVYAAVDQISSSFIYSAEYIARNRDNSQYVADLYYAFLRRGGDLPGVNFWINQLNSGAQTREQLRKDFINTPEFNARVNAIIAQGCLP